MHMLARGLDNPTLQTRVNFIAEMNRTAQRLGLANTFYRLPYGDGGTAEDRTTTAAELARLAAHALRFDLFREIVGTAEYATEVTTADGGSRQAKWQNTNQLLGLGEGYDGVKTGTTDLAGRCLVARGRRDGRHLLVVVLGAAPEPARYVDARNLFAWAWQQRLGH